MKETYHKVIDNVPASQYNSLLKLMNPHLTGDQSSSLPFVMDGASNSISFLSDMDRCPYIPLPPNAKVLSGEDVLRMHEVNGHTSVMSRGIITEATKIIDERVTDRGIAGKHS